MRPTRKMYEREIAELKTEVSAAELNANRDAERIDALKAEVYRLNKSLRFISKLEKEGKQ